jgi:hypothetical protein
MYSPHFFVDSLSDFPDDCRDGVCIYPFVVDQQTGEPHCYTGMIKGQMGCIYHPVLSQESCLNSLVPGAFWKRPATNQLECDAHGTAKTYALGNCIYSHIQTGLGCRENRYIHLKSESEGLLGQPGDIYLNSKSDKDCLAAGGTITPYYAWCSGEWVVGASTTWNTLSWKRREWKVLNTGVQLLPSQVILGNQLALSHKKFKAQSQQTYQYCR